MESNWIENRKGLWMFKVNRCFVLQLICAEKISYENKSISTFVVDPDLLHNPEDTKSIEWLILSRREVGNGCSSRNAENFIVVRNEFEPSNNVTDDLDGRVPHSTDLCPPRGTELTLLK
jgi:hypothetical protein